MTKRLLELLADLDNVKALLFDFDQTLADTKKCWELADRRFIESYGKTEINGHREVFFDFWKSEEGQIYNTIERATVFFRQFYGIECENVFEIMMDFVKEYYANAKLNPGAFEFVENMKIKGKRIAIVTNGHEAYINEFFKNNTGFRELIDIVVTSDHVGKNAKPNPYPYIFAMNRLNVTSEECIVFEDSEEGRISASSAGIATCIICPTKHNKVEYERLVEKSDYYVDNYEILIEEDFAL